MNNAPLDEQCRYFEIEISPLEANDLAGAKSEAPGDQDHGPVRLPNVRQQLVKLLRGEHGWPFQAPADILHPNQPHRIVFDQFPTLSAFEQRGHKGPDIPTRFRHQRQTFQPILNGHGFDAVDCRLSPTRTNVVVQIRLV